MRPPLPLDGHEWMLPLCARGRVRVGSTRPSSVCVRPVPQMRCVLDGRGKGMAPLVLAAAVLGRLCGHESMSTCTCTARTVHPCSRSRSSPARVGQDSGGELSRQAPLSRCSHHHHRHHSAAQVQGAGVRPPLHTRVQHPSHGRTHSPPCRCPRTGWPARGGEGGGRAGLPTTRTR